MKYSIYQIVLTSEDADEINGMENPARDHPKYASYIQTSLANSLRTFEAAEPLYEKVAEIDAEDLDEVFLIGNIGPDSDITRLKPMHSLSVGDIIVDPFGDAHGIASVGFISLKMKMEML